MENEPVMERRLPLRIRALRPGVKVGASLFEPMKPRRHPARVRLGPFIQENMERVLVDREAFAKTL